MKAIILNTAAADNGGARRDAGDELAVGDMADAITIERAEALVAAGSATEMSSSSTAVLQEAKAGKARSRTVPDAASDEAE